MSAEVQVGLAGQVRKLLDRQAIHDCVVRYCRGVDRFDREMVLSAYHPDAIDYHGEFEGTPEQFVEWAFGYHSQHQMRTQHTVLNHHVELDGDSAHAETYWIFIGANVSGDPLTMSGGRYVDRFERRDERWAIATRVCVHEWRTRLDPTEPHALLEAYAKGVRSERDISYERPLASKLRSGP
jgi:hypothetical protein